MGVWRLIYDVRDQGPLGGVGLWLVLLAAVVAVAAMFARDARRDRRRSQAAFAVLILVFAGVCAVLLVAGSYVRHRQFVDALDGGHARVLQGQVEDLRAEPSGCHGVESFVVAGQRFAYAGCVHTGAFNTPGRLQAGQEIRLAAWRGEILRLEVRESGR